jgi:hypothetical protein
MVVDSARHPPIVSVSAEQGGPGLEDNATDNFFSPTGGVYRLRVSTLPGGASARFRFRVYEINTAPEKVAARVRSGSLSDYQIGTAPYEFFVRRGRERERH